MVPRKISLGTAAQSISKPWSPVILGDVNESQIKMAKFDGEFDWHAHPNEDEAFLVVEGKIEIQFRTGNVVLDKGDLLVVPRGVEHRPRSLTEMPVVLMFEPATTVNTGDRVTEKTKTVLERI
jgi:mannose-6-phosphate isomerase-like protein (cupin superfamily)